MLVDGGPPGNFCPGPQQIVEKPLFIVLVMVIY